MGKGKELLSDIGRKTMLKVLTGESSKGYKNQRKNDKKLWINIHYWIDFIGFHVCWSWYNASGGLFSSYKHIFEDYNKMSTSGPVPNINLGLVTYVQKIMS